jgi:hypothetical protein
MGEASDVRSRTHTRTSCSAYLSRGVLSSVLGASVPGDPTQTHQPAVQHTAQTPSGFDHRVRWSNSFPPCRANLVWASLQPICPHRRRSMLKRTQHQTPSNPRPTEIRRATRTRMCSASHITCFSHQKGLHFLRRADIFMSPIKI